MGGWSDGFGIVGRGVMLGCSALATANEPPSVAPGSTSPDATRFGAAEGYGNAFALPIAGITIDGKLDDWPAGLETHGIAEVSTAYTPIPPAGPRDFSAHFQAGYDPVSNTLYLAVVVEDDELVTHPEAPNFSNQDLCEVYIDADHSGNDQIANGAGNDSAVGAQRYIMTPGSGVAFDKADTNPALVGDEENQSGVKATSRREGTTTTYEWAIPLYTTFPDQPFKAQAGKTIGFDVVVVDAEGREKGNWISWSPRFKVFNSIAYGHLTLLENYQSLGVLSGTLADGQHPGTGVALEVWRGGLRISSLRTDAQGRYQMHLLPGEYTLKVKGGQGFVPDSVTAVVRAREEINFRLAQSPMVLPEILRQIAAAYQGLQAYADTTLLETHEMSSGVDHPAMRSTPIAWVRPNRFRIEHNSQADRTMLISDGRQVSQYPGRCHQYTQEPAPPVLAVGHLQGQFGLSSFLLGHQLLLSGDPLQVLMARVEVVVEQGREVLEGTPVVVVELRQPPRVVDPSSRGEAMGVRLWIGAEDHLLRQRVYKMDLEVAAINGSANLQHSRGIVERHRGIRVNAAVPAEVFTFVPPPALFRSVTVN